MASKQELQPGVLIITQTLDIGGLERMVLNLAEQLQLEQRWRVHVLAYDQASKFTESLLPDFVAKSIPVEAFCKRRGFSADAILRIIRNIRRHNIQVIHTQDLGGLLYAVIVKALHLGKVQIVHTQHSFIHLTRKARYRLYEKFLSRFVDNLCVVSEDTKKTYVDLGIPASNITLIQNGVRFCKIPHLRSQRLNERRALIARIPDKTVRLRLSALANGYLILYLARFFPGKGQSQALELWRRLNASLRGECVLCFIGPESAPGEYQKVRTLINNTPDNERIFLLDGTSDPWSWLSVGDLYLSCSEFEGMPLGPLEAVGAGLPALLSAIPGHEFLKNFSIQFSLRNPEQGAKELEGIIAKIKNEKLYFKELWNNATFLREYYSVERMSKRYSSLYLRPVQKLTPLMEAHG